MVLVQTNYIPFQRKLSSLSSLSFSLYQMLQLLNHHCGLSLDSLQFVHVLLALVSPSLNPALRVCLISAERRERITSRDLLAMLLLMQPQRLLAFFATRADHWVMFSLSTMSPRSFFAELLSRESAFILC